MREADNGDLSNVEWYFDMIDMTIDIDYITKWPEDGTLLQGNSVGTV